MWLSLIWCLVAIGLILCGIRQTHKKPAVFPAWYSAEVEAELIILAEFEKAR